MDILIDSETNGSNSAKIPLGQNPRLSREEEELLVKPALYRRLIDLAFRV